METYKIIFKLKNFISFIGCILRYIFVNDQSIDYNIAITKLKLDKTCDIEGLKKLNKLSVERFRDLLFSWETMFNNLDILKTIDNKVDCIKQIFTSINDLILISDSLFRGISTSVIEYIDHPKRILKKEVDFVDFKIEKIKVIIDNLSGVLLYTENIKEIIKNKPSLLFRYTLYYDVNILISSIKLNISIYNKLLSQLNSLKNNINYKNIHSLYDKLGYDINEKMNKLLSFVPKISNGASKKVINIFLENIKNIKNDLITNIILSKTYDENLYCIANDYIYELNEIIFICNKRIREFLLEEYEDLVKEYYVKNKQQYKNEKDEYQPIFVKNDIIITESLTIGVLVLSVNTEKEEYICKFNDMVMTIPFKSQDMWHKIGTYTDNEEVKALLNGIEYINNNKKKSIKNKK